MNGAVEFGASHLYVSVGCGCAAGGVRVQGKQVGSGGPSEREAVAQGHGCGAVRGEGRGTGAAVGHIGRVGGMKGGQSQCGQA